MVEVPAFLPGTYSYITHVTTFSCTYSLAPIPTDPAEGLPAVLIEVDDVVPL